MATDRDRIVAYQQAAQQVRDRLIAVSRATWWSLPAYRDADIDRLVETIVPKVLAGERQIAQLTDAYLSGMALKDARGVDERAVSGIATRGVPPEDVYRRPAVTVYTELSQGKPYAVALDAGLARLLSLVATDLQLAQRLQEQASLGRLGYDYYRRTLTGRENCLLCMLASTQRYHQGVLKPIHPGCDCGIAQISAASDPGQILNEEMVEAIHAASGGDFTFNRSGRAVEFADGTRRDYNDLLVREHGELGPVLTWRHQKFTSAADLAA